MTPRTFGLTLACVTLLAGAVHAQTDCGLKLCTTEAAATQVVEVGGLIVALTPRDAQIDVVFRDGKTTVGAGRLARGFAWVRDDNHSLSAALDGNTRGDTEEVGDAEVVVDASEPVTLRNRTGDEAAVQVRAGALALAHGVDAEARTSTTRIAFGDVVVSLGSGGDVRVGALNGEAEWVARTGGFDLLDPQVEWVSRTALNGEAEWVALPVPDIYRFVSSTGRLDLQWLEGAGTLDVTVDGRAFDGQE